MSDFMTLCTIAHQAPQSMGILQARILEWVGMPFSTGSSWPSDQTHVLLHCRLILYPLSHEGGPNIYVFKIEKKTTQTKKPPCHPAPVQSSSWHFEKTQCVQTMAFCSACICYRPPSRSVQFQSDSMVQNKVMNLRDPTVSLSSSCLTWPAQPVPTSHPQYK